MQLGGLHHVTAITGNASRNVAFYTQVLGMHLVKKTVNQVDVSAYHLFYADDIGHAGKDMTFFDWPEVGPSLHGTGTISATMFGVRGRVALDWWVQRLDAFGIEHDGIQTSGKGGRAVLVRDSNRWPRFRDRRGPGNARRTSGSSTIPGATQARD